MAKVGKVFTEVRWMGERFVFSGNVCCQLSRGRDRRDMVLFVVGDLPLPACVRLVDGMFHRGRDRVGDT